MGPAAISVLKPMNLSFQGRLSYLTEIRAAVTVPLLRKDFILDRYQLLEARVAGADAVLLIAEILDELPLRDLLGETHKLGMQALVELLTTPANFCRRYPRCRGQADRRQLNRDLRTFDTRLERTLELAPTLAERLLPGQRERHSHPGRRGTAPGRGHQGGLDRRNLHAGRRYRQRPSCVSCGEFAMSLIDEVRRYFFEAGLAHTRGVVALSGGPDSVALAHVLVRLLRDGFFTQLVLAHVNHQLRGEESDADEVFVQQIAESWREGSNHLRCETIRIDVMAAVRAEGNNLEKTARELRYRWLEKIVCETEADWLATGHSADDQAETVVHRLLRGAGLQGLTAIAPRRRLTANADIVRPLLSVRRGDILAYLGEQALAFRQDNSNLDVKFTRAAEFDCICCRSWPRIISRPSSKFCAGSRIRPAEFRRRLSS